MFLCEYTYRSVDIEFNNTLVLPIYSPFIKGFIMASLQNFRNDYDNTVDCEKVFYSIPLFVTHYLY